MRIGLLGTLAVYDEAGRPVRIGGYRVRMLLIVLALDVGRVVPAYSLIERLWEDEPRPTRAMRCNRWSPGCVPRCARAARATR